MLFFISDLLIRLFKENHLCFDNEILKLIYELFVQVIVLMPMNARFKCYTLYCFQNFTALQSYQVMKVINEMTKMSHLRNISVYSIESGSVVFSWFYDQLAAEPNPCSSINQLKDKLLTEDRTPHPQLVQRYLI